MKDKQWSPPRKKNASHTTLDIDECDQGKCLNAKSKICECHCKGRGHGILHKQQTASTTRRIQ